MHPAVSVLGWCVLSMAIRAPLARHRFRQSN
jgi:hypothetical protein